MGMLSAEMKPDTESELPQAQRRVVIRSKMWPIIVKMAEAEENTCYGSCQSTTQAGNGEARVVG